MKTASGSFLFTAASLAAALLFASKSAAGQTAALPKPTPAIQALLDQAAANGISPKERVAKYQAALDEASKAGDLDGQGAALKGIGNAHLDAGEQDAALSCYNQALPIYRAAGDRDGEAKVLANIGNVYRSLGDSRKALDYYGQALPAYRAVGDRDGAAKVLVNTGIAYYLLNDKRTALDDYLQALPTFEAVGDKNGEAGTLTDIGIVYNDLGEKRAALEYYNKALPILRAVGNRQFEANTLVAIGIVYRGVGDKRKALDYYRQALPMYKALGDRDGEAKALERTGNAYQDLNEGQKALDCYNQALPIYRSVGDRYNEAATLFDFGSVYRVLGDKRKALDYFHEALPIYRAVDDRIGQANVLDGIGDVYRDLGEMRKSLDYHCEALPIYRTLNDKDGEANALDGIGGSYFGLGEKRNALSYYEQALLIVRAMGNRSDEATALNNIGLVYGALGEIRKALDYYRKALPICKSVGSRDGEANALRGIGIEYFDLGEPQKALEYYWQVLPIYRAVDNKYAEANALTNVGIVYDSIGLHTLGIVVGKRACNIYESLRGNVNASVPRRPLLGAGEARALADSSQLTGSYEFCAKALADLKRTQEFQEVLRLWKTDSSRGNAQSVPLTEEESKWSKEFESRLSTLAEVVAKIDVLRSVETLSMDQKKELKGLVAKQTTGQDEFDRYLKQLENDSKHADPSMNRVRATIASHETDMALGLLPTGSAVVYAIPGDKSVDLVVVKRGVRSAVTVPVNDLDQKVQTFAHLLQEPSRDPRPLGKALYDILIKPIAAHLESRGVTIWSLTGVLRAIPIDALWDGKDFVLKRFPSSSFSPAYVASLFKRSKPNDKALVFGATQAEVVKDPISGQDLSFSQLKGARQEAESIALALGTTPSLDFSLDALTKGIAAKPSVIHLASHFRYVPGDDRRSFLMSGDGKAFTVEQIKSLPDDALKSVKLITLSACGTGTGQSATGEESESFAGWMQRKGAQAVLSTLWPVDDASTAALMGDFYRIWHFHPGLTKLGALRQAKLYMLRGTLQGGNSARRAETSTEPVKSTAPPWPKNMPKYAHPYYWAPFVLTGNWK